MAATTVAVRVAEEMQVRLGQEVGYSIRFEDVTSSSTRIKFMTDGLLLREALVDPLLSRYSVIMVDEAHERSLSTDVLLGVLKKIMRKRPELRIIVSSATLQAEDFLCFFTSVEENPRSKPSMNGASKPAPPIMAQIISLEGRMYPVDTLFLDSPSENYLDSAIATVREIHASEPPGDILVFLTGREEIESAYQTLSTSYQPNSQSPSLLPLPLYAGLPTSQQELIFDLTPEGRRKVILSTNIAEASLTIPGIIYIVDPGFVKLRTYNPISGIARLTAVPISRASAVQRAGRAGRMKPGKCFRLYTEATFHAMHEATIPEIQRSDLAPTILQLKALGIDNIARFAFITAPPAELIIRALDHLFALGALDEDARLSKPLGTRMAELALEPMLAKALLEAPKFGCLPEMLSVAAMLSLGGEVWVEHGGGGGDDSDSDDEGARRGRKGVDLARRKFAAEEGDHITLLNVYAAFTGKQGKRDARWCVQHRLNYKALCRAVSVRNQLWKNLSRFGIVGGEEEEKVVERGARRGRAEDGREEARSKGEQIARCLTAGYFAHAASMQADGTFRTVDGGTVLHAHPSSLMFVSGLFFLTATGQHIYRGLFYTPLLPTVHHSLPRMASPSPCS